jgi:hypothetical protein
MPTAAGCRDTPGPDVISRPMPDLVNKTPDPVSPVRPRELYSEGALSRPGGFEMDIAAGCGKLILSGCLKTGPCGTDKHAPRGAGPHASGRSSAPAILGMRVYHFLYILLVSDGAVVAQAPASPPNPPTAAGVYYHQGEAGWTTLARPVMADTKTEGMGRFLDTYGWSNLNRTMVFQGAEAGVRIPDPRPTFYARSLGSAQDVIIVQVAKKKESREIQASSTNASVNNKEGFKRGSIYRVTATVLAKDLYSVTPEVNLKPGEYLLVFGHAETAYEFGIPSGLR